MAKTIKAQIPARKLGKAIIDGRVDTYNQDDDGRWSSPDFGSLTEEDVIDMSKRASNWDDIRRKNFPMYGFHS